MSIVARICITCLAQDNQQVSLTSFQHPLSPATPPAGRFSVSSGTNTSNVTHSIHRPMAGRHSQSIAVSRHVRLLILTARHASPSCKPLSQRGKAYHNLNRTRSLKRTCRVSFAKWRMGRVLNSPPRNLRIPSQTGLVANCFQRWVASKKV